MVLRKSASGLFAILQEPDEDDRRARANESLDILRAESSSKEKEADKQAVEALAAGDIGHLVSTMLGDLYVPYSRLSNLVPIGEGGFAFVYKATLTYPSGLRQVVAVKALREDRVQDDEELDEFITEANLWRKLQSKDVVKLVGIGAKQLDTVQAVKKTLYVVCEYMAGGTLQEMVRRQMLSPTKDVYSFQEAFRWFVDITRAVKYLHGCNPAIVHRDLKLENVLLTSRDNTVNEAKILDLGLHMRGRPARGGEEKDEGSFYGGNMYDSFLANGSVRPALKATPAATLADKVKEAEARKGDVMLQTTPPPSQSKHGSNLGGTALMPISEEEPSERRPMDQEAEDVSARGQDRSVPGPGAEPHSRPQSTDGRATSEASKSPSGDGGPRAPHDTVTTTPSKESMLHTRKVGSYMYMAPEMVAGHTYSESVDVFSLIVMFYEVLRGRSNLLKIAVNGDPSEVMKYADRVADGFREDIPSNWPAEVRALLSDGWHQDPDLRIPMSEVYQRVTTMIAQGVPEYMDQHNKHKPYSASMGCSCSVQ